MTGWIKLHRQLSELKLWLAEPFTRGQAWVDLLMLANHEDGYIRIRGNRVEVKRGQVGWSQQALAKRWKWSRHKVSNFFEEMEKIEHQIEQQKNKISSIITIINYEEYQQTGHQEGHQKDIRRTSEGHQKDTNKNGKKNKNDKNIKNKNIYGTHVELSEDEHKKLSDKFGSQLPDVIDYFNLKIESKGLSSWKKEHKSDYATILYWDKNGWIKLNGGNNGNGDYSGTNTRQVNQSASKARDFGDGNPYPVDYEITE